MSRIQSVVLNSVDIGRAPWSHMLAKWAFLCFFAAGQFVIDVVQT